MSAGADVKTVLDALEVLTAVFREGEEFDEAQFPYATFLDPISEVPAVSGDAKALGWRRLIQVDLWQDGEAPDDTLIEQVREAVDGAPTADGYRLRWLDAVVIPEADRVLHHSITLSVSRARYPSAT